MADSSRLRELGRVRSWRGGGMEVRVWISCFRVSIERIGDGKFRVLCLPFKSLIKIW